MLPLLLLKKLRSELGTSGWCYPAAVAKGSSDAIIWLDHIHASLCTGDRGWEYIQ